ncbi:MAG TPA: NPCBM/NEW2 domain-containing protein [Actinomycetota bacterium]|nr:NPCBM/NEW2 domain-containing protein [Actinomycetota bacterium]
MTDERDHAQGVNRGLVVLSILLVAVTGWALATRDGGAPVTEVDAPIFWVATDGDDAAPGTQDEPWATLQRAADTVPPGAVVYVREGTYAQRFDLHVSGVPGRTITFTPAPGEDVVLDGSTLQAPAGQSAMIEIDSQRYVSIEGFEITGYASSESGHVPIGIFVTGSADHVRLSRNFIHDMGTTFAGRNGGDAHGIGVFGTTSAHPIEEIDVLDNELANLTLGSSEALVVNGNVKDFLIEGNRVHDTNNIGIDVIGFEGTAPDPTVDQARDGIVRGNTVWNIDSYANPAYGDSRSADGVYVDGGRDVVVEANVIHDVNIGIELASEHAGRSTRNVTVRNNLVYDATTIGVAIGGYDRRRGSTEDCVIVNNTVVNTDGPELLVQFDTRRNLIANNVIVASADAIFVENPYEENVDNVLDANLYYSVDGSSEGTWQWKGVDYGDFDTWRSRSGNDRHSMFADPGFAGPAAQDFSLVAGSPAVDAGVFAATSGSTDLAGGSRAQGGSVDMGAFEVEPPPASPTPSIAGAVTYAGDLPWLKVRNGWGDPEVDRSNGERAPDDGVPIMIGTRSFEHGIGAHAPSRIVVELDGRCSLFLADVGVDEEVGEAGSVVFEVWAGDERLATTGLVRGSQASVPIAADVEGSSSVTMVVTTAGDGPANDHADWGDARFACEG